MNFEPANRPTFPGTFAEINNGYLDRLISPCYHNVTLCCQIAALLERWTLEEFPSSLFRQRIDEMYNSWRKSLNICRKNFILKTLYVLSMYFVEYSEMAKLAEQRSSKRYSFNQTSSFMDA